MAGVLTAGVAHDHSWWEEVVYPGAIAEVWKRRVVEALSCHRSGVEAQAGHGLCCHTWDRCGNHCRYSVALAGSTHQGPCQPYHLLEQGEDLSFSPDPCDGNPARGCLGTWGGPPLLQVTDEP